MQAAGETPPWPGAPAEWTADQQLLWSLTVDYRAIGTAVAAGDGELPEPEVLESPAALHEWFDGWVEARKRIGPDRDDREEHGWILK